MAEDWSAKGFYQTMLRAWRLCEGPFYLKRPLSADEYRGAADIYIRRASQNHLMRMQEAPLTQKVRNAKKLRSVKIPYPKLDFDWELEIAIGQFECAETVKSQASARRHLRAFAYSDHHDRSVRPIMIMHSADRDRSSERSDVTRLSPLYDLLAS